MGAGVLRFALGHGAVFTAVCVATIVPNNHGMPARAGAWFAMVIALGAVPIAAAAGAGLLLHILSPRRVFDTRILRSHASAAFGVLSGLLALVLDGLLAASFDPWATSAGWLAATSFLASGFVLVTLARRRVAGCCMRCEYDLSASLAYGRCPECGTHF